MCLSSWPVTPSPDAELLVGGQPCATCHQTCETLIIRHTIILGTIKGKKSKLWAIIDFKTHPNFRDVKMWWENVYLKALS